MIRSNHLSPEQITKRLGITPSRTEARESRRGSRSGRLIPPCHEWIADSGLPETASLDDQGGGPAGPTEYRRRANRRADGARQ
ncbi:DUF4279 domain-containing protein [Microtetraspora glauca]|uniref:DUF4279 domain-containing protein n=1 Tax=Microtetraspora glauca TaxID=1996 RepID=A0ABV3GR80_MICGL